MASKSCDSLVTSYARLIQSTCMSYACRGQSQSSCVFNGIICTFVRYHAITGDVLTSIKRTEDSLMRLKRSRKQPATGKESQSAAMSDDDKIRLQFTLDTEEFGRAVRHQQLSQTANYKYTEVMVKCFLSSTD